jgi:hypothetical protein
MSQFSMPGIPQNIDPQFALDMAATLRQQAAAIRSSPDAGMETISYRVRRGGIAGFFGATKKKTETRLRPGAQQLLDNAAMFEQQATYFDTLSSSMSSLEGRQEELEAAATAEEEEALGVQKPVSEGGQQYTRNDLVRTANRNRLGIMLGGNNMMGISINPGGTLGGLRIPTGS